MPFGLCRTQWCGNRQVGGPQVEKEKPLGGLTECACITYVAPAPFLFPLPPPLTVRGNSHPLFVLCGLIFCPLAAGKGRSPHFHKQLNAGALLRAFSYLGSLFSEWFRAGFNLGINLTKVQNLLLCMENALQSVVYLSSSHLLPFHPNLWSLKRLKMLLRHGIVLIRQLLMSSTEMASKLCVRTFLHDCIARRQVKGEGEGLPAPFYYQLFSSWGKADHKDVQIWKLEAALEAEMQRGSLPSPAHLTRW